MHEITGSLVMATVVLVVVGCLAERCVAAPAAETAKTAGTARVVKAAEIRMRRMPKGYRRAVLDGTAIEKSEMSPMAGSAVERYSPKMDEASLLQQLRIPESAAVRDVWPSEPYDFTPWLADHLEMVAEHLKLGSLELVETEKSIPGTGRALDILARLPTGGLVAIENQYGVVDHDHFTRGLAYAVGLNAVALVLVAEGHLDEFRAVAAYLNSVAERSDAESRIGIYLLSLSVEQVEEYVIPRFSLLESPNTWIEGLTNQRALQPKSIEDFFAAVAEPTRSEMRKVLDWWVSEPKGSVRSGAQTAISLDRPRPGTVNVPTSHVVFNTNGTFTLQRGYLLNAGIVPSDRQEEFDSFIRETFPEVVWQGKHYHLNGPGAPDLLAVQALVEWLDSLDYAPLKDGVS